MNVLKFSSKIFGKLIPKREMVLKENYKELFLPPIRNSVSLLLSLSIFYPLDKYFSSLLQRMKELVEFKLVSATESKQIILEGFFMILMLKQKQMKYPVHDIYFSEDNFKLLFHEKYENNQFAIGKKLENTFVEISQVIKPFLEFITDKYEYYKKQYVQNIHTNPKILLTKPPSDSFEESKKYSFAYENLIIFILGMMEIIFKKFIEKSAKNSPPGHSIFISHLFSFILDLKNDFVPISLRFLACKVIEGALSSLLEFQQGSSSSLVSRKPNSVDDNPADMSNGDSQEFWPSEEDIQLMVQQHNLQKSQEKLLHFQFLQCKYLTQLLKVFVADHLLKIISFLSSNNLSNQPNQSSTDTQRSQQQNHRLLEKTSKLIGEIASLHVFFSLERWEYYFGRFGSLSKWTKLESTPALMRQVPIRVFTSSINYSANLYKMFHSIIPVYIKNYPSSPLDEIQLLQLWLFNLIEPKHNFLKYSFTAALVNDLPLFQKLTIIPNVLTPQLLALYQSTDPASFKTRKNIIYHFLEQVSKNWCKPNSNLDELAKIKILFFKLFQSIPQRLCYYSQEELVKELGKINFQYLNDYLHFSFSVIGKLLSDCHPLLYSESNANNLLRIIIDSFFKSDKMDLTCQLKYLPVLIRAISKVIYYFIAFWREFIA